MHTPLQAQKEADELDMVLDWARAASAPLLPGDCLEPDWGLVVTGGHSRGGDVAFKQLKFDAVKTAILVDAVSALPADEIKAPTSAPKPLFILGTPCSHFGCAPCLLQCDALPGQCHLSLTA
jgi:hypothetical protein